MMTQDGFNITAQSGAVFKDVDLQDDFADYDGRDETDSLQIEKADEAVSVMNMEWKIE